MEEKPVELVPPQGAQGTKKEAPLRKVCVKLYLGELEFLTWVKLAEDAGIRPRGLKPFRLKPHGFAEERVANTKGLVKFVKKRVLPYWVEGEAARKAKELQLRAEAQALGLEVKKA